MFLRSLSVKRAYAVSVSFCVCEFMWTVFEKSRRESSATGIVEKEVMVVRLAVDLDTFQRQNGRGLAGSVAVAGVTRVMWLRLESCGASRICRVLSPLFQASSTKISHSCLN